MPSQRRLDGIATFWLLKEIRDGRIKDDRFFDRFGTRHGAKVASFLRGLEKLGAIKRDKGGRIEPLEWINDFTSTFDISLTEMSDFIPGISIVANPIFDEPSSDLTTPDIFVLMPFEDRLTRVYQDHISKVSGQTGL